MDGQSFGTVEPEVPDGEADPLIGERLGDVVIKKVRGAGGMGTVYEGEQEMLGGFRRVAVKVLRHRSGVAGAELCWRLREREVRALAAVTHPNVVRCYGANEAEVKGTRYSYVVMELIEGPTLEQYVKTYPQKAPHRYGCSGLPIREALRLIALITAGLRALHEAGIVHRDLKPENVIMCLRDGAAIPIIIDLGLAKGDVLERQGRKTRYEGAIGTAHTMAPEQCGGGQLVDKRADVYALAAMLHFLLTGFYPGEDGKYVNGFAPEDEQIVDGWMMHTYWLSSLAQKRDASRWFTSVKELLREGFAATGTKPSESEERFLKEIDEFLRRALAPHPDDRPTSVDAFLEALPEIPEVLRPTPIPVSAAPHTVRYGAPPYAARYGAPPLSFASDVAPSRLARGWAMVFGATGVLALVLLLRLFLHPAPTTASTMATSLDAGFARHERDAAALVAPPIVPEAEAVPMVLPLPDAGVLPEDRPQPPPSSDGGRRRHHGYGHGHHRRDAASAATEPESPCENTIDPVTHLFRTCL